MAVGMLLAGAGDDPAESVRALLRAGKPADALARAVELLHAEPAQPALLVLAGDAARAAGDRTSAARHYGRAFELAGKVAAYRKAPPPFVEAANGLARLRLEDGDAAGAEKVLAFAYLHYPGDRDTLTNLGVAAAMRGEWDRAERFLARATADVLASELWREVERLRALAPAAEAAGRIVVEPFATDGSAGRRAGWGLVASALVRRSLATATAAGAAVVTGNVADVDGGLTVTVRVLRPPDRAEIAAFEVRVADPAALRAALEAQLGKIRPRL